MKILYYIAPRNDANAINHELTTMLARTLSQHAEVTCGPPPTPPKGGESNRGNSSRPTPDPSQGRGEQSSQLLTPHSSLLISHSSLLTSHSPSLAGYDLIHLFGCWDMSTIRLQKQAHRLHIPTVFSPMGGLQPWVMRHHKRSFLLSSQREAVQLASAVHLCGKLESDLFEPLKWNRRRALIKNAIVTSLVSFDEMAAQLLQLYQKVLDTQARLLLSPESQQAIGHLLELGVNDQVLLEEEHCRELKALLAALGPADWRRIWLYADEECIGELLVRALDRIQFRAPECSIADIERFATANRYDGMPIECDKLTYKSLTVRGKMAECLGADDVNERRCIIALLNLRHGMAEHTAPLLHLADVYSMLRFSNMDEDKLKDSVKALGIERFAERLMTVMQHVMRLSEGFMPFAPRDDRDAAQMEQTITKFGLWA